MRSILFLVGVALALLSHNARADYPPVNTCGIENFPPCPPTPTPGPTPIQTPSPMEGCVLMSKVDTKTSGRFIWKPRAEHFFQALVVAPRHFYPSTPRVQIWNASGPFVERMRLKSDGRCSGHPECLFASTFLARKMGRYYERRYGSINVRIKDPSHPELGCYYYHVRFPGRRAEFR